MCDICTERGWSKEFVFVAVPERTGEDPEIAPSLKVEWKAKKADPTNGGYSKELLERLFSKVGHFIGDDVINILLLFQFGVDHVLVSKKRKGRAVVSFHSAVHAVSP